ncbi:MAG: hypothetical protein AAF297_11500, partial [Planctomycetota bacterium]
MTTKHTHTNQSDQHDPPIADALAPEPIAAPSALLAATARVRLRRRLTTAAALAPVVAVALLVVLRPAISSQTSPGQPNPTHNTPGPIATNTNPATPPTPRPESLAALTLANAFIAFDNNPLSSDLDALVLPDPRPQSAPPLLTPAGRYCRAPPGPARPAG